MKRIFWLIVVVAVVGPGTYLYFRREPVVSGNVYADWYTSSDKPLIVFVHGLGGDPHDTWDRDGHSFMELLEKDPAFSDYAVVSMYYRSGLLQGDPTIAQLATSFAAWLDKHFDKNTEIIIIAHSLGGIIARQGLVQCDFKNRKDQFVTLITLASPFDGSNLPDFSRLLATFRISSRQLDALRLRSDALELCENGWIDLVKIHGQRIRQFAAAEGRSTKGIVVVSEESATRKVPRNCVFRSDEDDHLSIAKPSSLEAGIGKQVRDWIINRRYNEGDYIIGYNLQIPAAGSLVIESGTKITFKDAKFIVKGRVDAAGTQSKPVKFAFESTSGEDTAIVLRGESVAKSRFEYCTFQKGHGVGVKKPGPQTFRKSSRKDAWGEKETTLTSKALHYGGAMTLIGTNDVTISKCEFVENEAYQGGALALLGCVRVKIEDSRFQKNVSGFGGGAIFAQASDFEVRSNCRFEQNSTGQMVAAYKDVSDARFACGGAVYLGYMARCNIDHDVFEENKASNSGGAIYIQDSHPAGSENIAGSELTELVFSANESRNDGAAVYVAGESRGVISSPTFKDNVVGSKPAEDGASCVDQSKVGLAVTNAAWIRNGEPYIDECRRPTK